MILRGILVSLYIFSVHSFVYAKSITLNTAVTEPLSTPKFTDFIDTVVFEAFRRINKKLNPVHLPAELALKNSNLGVIDGELIRIEGMEKIYPSLIRVPEKIMDMEFVTFSNRGIRLNLKWDSLANYSVTFLNGWEIYEINVPKSTIITRVNNPKQLFLLLNKNRAYIILYERWLGLFNIMKKDGTYLAIKNKILTPLEKN